MPFPSVLNGTQLTNIRDDNYNGQAYIAVCPNTLVFRALVNQSTFATSFAQVIYDNVTTGAYTDIRQGMTVFIGLTTDLNEAVFIGRVRKTPTSTILYINETSAAVLNNMYISVIDDRRIWERLQRVDPVTRVRYKDWDITYTNLLPVIAGLQSSYVLVTSGVSASQTFTPTATALASGATITSWLWDVGDGTITIGTSTTQNITVSFPTGHRWVRLTVTDSGGRTNFMDFEVYCGDPRSASWSLLQATDISVSGDLQTGYNGGFTAVGGVSGLLENTRMTIFTIERYGASSDPMVSNVGLVGYVRIEANQTAGDSVVAQRKDVRYTIEGFGTQLGNTLMAGISAIDDATPTQWGEITSPTPPRFVGYALTYHTTATNLMSVKFGVDDNDYIFIDLSAESSSALDSLQGCYDQINGAISFAQTGELELRRNANYLDSPDRNFLIEVADIQTQDLLSFTIEREYGYRVGQVLGGFGGYTTSTGVPRAYSSKAPAQASLGAQEYQQLNSQILTANQTDLQNRVEAGQRIADHLAYINPKPRIDITLRDGWWWITPSVFQWYTFTINVTDNLRNIEYDTNNRWLCTSVSWSQDNSTGRRQVSATFELETRGGNSQVLTSLIPAVSDLNNPILPVVPDYPFFPPNPNINYPTDSPSFDEFQPISPNDLGQLQPTPPPVIPQGGQAGCRTIQFSFQKTTNTPSGFLTANGQDYVITVRGETQFTGWSQTFDFTTSAGLSDGWGLFTVGTYTPTVGYTQTSVGISPAAVTGVELFLTLPTRYITQVSFTFTVTYGTFTAGSGVSVINLRLGGGYVQTNSINAPSTPTSPYSVATNITADQVDIALYSSYLGDGLGQVTITSCTITGEGVNPFAGATDTPKGDAFYWTYNTNPDGLAELNPVGQGLYIDNAQASAPTEYNPNHEYQFIIVGTGNEFQFRYEIGTGDVLNTPMFVTMCGPDAGTVTS
jgi:hypothetical protein